MTYTPSETEKSLATFLQVASIFLFFFPGVVIRRTRWWRSPYIRFWARANTIWSIVTFVPAATLLILCLFVNTKAPFLAVWSVHALMTVMCAFASMFNRPFGYIVITNKYCLREMANVYGAAVRPMDDSDKK